jgi:hypothetical protein
MFALGEARTHGLQIMRLTRCLLRYEGLVNSSSNYIKFYKNTLDSFLTFDDET